MWDYSGDPATSAKDTVRFLVRDTNEDDPLAQDEEIAWVLTQFPNVYQAAATVAETIAGSFASKAEIVQVLDVKLAYKTRDQNYRDLADRLRQTAIRAGGVTPYAGGISIADKESRELDSDRVQPAFSRGMFANPRAGGDTEVSLPDQVTTWP